MKILIGHNYYQQPGGEDVVFSSEVNLLRRHGHTVVEYRESNIRLQTMGRIQAFRQSLWSRDSFQAVKTLLRDSKPDIVHFHNIFPLISPSVYDACNDMDVPVVQTLHNYRLLCPVALLYRNGRVCEDCLGRWIAWPGVWHGCYHRSRVQTAAVASMLAFHRMRKTWQDRVAAYISLTNFSRSKFIEGGIPAAKIFVKPNFVYPDPGTGDSTGNFALFVGRLSPEKGVRTLLRTWLRTPDIPLQIIGGGTLNDEIRTQIMEAGLQRVELRGPLPHDQVLAIMKKACFLLFPSECYENFSLAVLEAFACNLPVIASRLGTMAEIIEDRRTGLLFTPGDSEDLAAKVEWGWTHREEMADMGAEARLEYERKFTANRNYQMLMGIYTGIHHKRRYVFQEDDS